jgi:proteasome accessory factor B/proteasome accessory factor C
MAQRKSERLINLVICLLAARRFIPRERIRASIEGYADLTEAAFLRSFERDKEELRRLGVPIETGPTDPWSDELDGYRIRRSDYELPALDLTPDESTLLGLAGAVWQEAALGEATGQAIAKLRASGVEISADRVVAVAPTLPTREPAFGIVWQAWLSRTPVRFTYHGKRRVLEPWRLVLRRGSWYVLGRDRAAGPRWYRLSRIEDDPTLQTGEAPYPTVTEEELAAYADRLDGPEPTHEARLAIRPDAAPALRRRGRRVEGPAPEGYDLFAVPYGHSSEIVDEACAAGARAVVLTPPDLQAKVVERLTFVSGLATPADTPNRLPHPEPPSGPADGPTNAAPQAGASPPSPRGSSANTSAEQVARLLLLIPYLQRHLGVSLTEAATAFHLTPEQIRRDLDVAFLCGLPGGLPGDLIEVDLDAVDDEGLIFLSNADTLDRPLTLRPDEAMGLIVALQGVREVAVADLWPVIDSLLAKLAALAPGAAGPVGVTVEAGAAPIRGQLVQAIERGERLRLTYDGLARGQTSRPVVDPARLFVADGLTYLSAWSLLRGDWRTYRVDRIAAVHPIGQPVEAHGAPPEATSWLHTLAAAPPVRLIVHPAAQWITDYYPVTEQVARPDGDIEVTLPVADPAWLRWLILRLGPGVTVLDSPAALAEAAEVARQALAAYAGVGPADG